MKTTYAAPFGDSFSVTGAVANVLGHVTPASLTAICEETTRIRADLYYRQLVSDPTNRFAHAWATYIIYAIDQSETDRGAEWAESLVPLWHRVVKTVSERCRIGLARLRRQFS